jgi:hypothetical protein
LANPAAGAPFTVYNRPDRTRTAFDDMPAPADAAMLARERAAAIRVLGRAANDIIKPGRVLLGVQVASPFGEFRQWGHPEFGRSPGTAPGWTRPAECLGGKTEIISAPFIRSDPLAGLADDVSAQVVS